ncbi:hypothetical protein [Amycolatopsis sp. WGS_07]|uniref:hypothetical protein n=1 Tax=Amycolatopsis sp. WGS_07 TaxID=3076764 RepID=UPI003872EE8D
MSAPAATVTVHHCAVTVVRRGGWSWGPDPRGLVKRALDALPDLLAAEFADQLAQDGPDVEITAPVTLTVRLGRGSAAGERAVVLHRPEPVAVAGGVAEPEAVSLEESFAPEPVGEGWSAPSFASLLAELAERGELEALLALLPDESLRRYLQTRAGLSSVPDEAVRPSTVAGLLAAELARRGLGPAPEVSPPEPDASPATPVLSSTVDIPRRETGEVRVWSVLPFLLTGPLARVGYLDAIGPALDGLDLADEAPLFAAALAYKVLGTTERGWRRAERDTAAAAAFAGYDVPEEALTGFARRVRPALPVLDGILALSLCRGHDPAEPLLIVGAADQLLLVDAQGLFPIAWAPTVAGLLPHWRASGSPPMLVRDSPLPPGCLRELATAGVRFATDVRPVRGDPVTRLPLRSPLWTSGGVDPRLAAGLPGHAERLGELVESLVVERRAIPLAADDDLERSVTLAAALGLGTMAWLLWRDRESPDPVLALRRFADLEATVRFERRAVRVRVPLGRRHADLLRAGLLSDVPGVGWLGGRTLTFSGG